MVLYSNGIVQNTHFRCLLLAQQDRGTRCENKVKMRLLKVAFEGLRGKNWRKAFLLGIKSWYIKIASILFRVDIYPIYDPQFLRILLTLG